MGIVDKSIEDSVGEGGIAEDFMPLLDRELTGDQGGGSAVSIIDDLHEVAPGIRVQGCQTPVVEDQEFDPAEAVDDLRVASVGAG